MDKINYDAGADVILGWLPDDPALTHEPIYTCDARLLGYENGCGYVTRDSHPLATHAAPDPAPDEMGAIDEAATTELDDQEF